MDWKSNETRDLTLADGQRVVLKEAASWLDGEVACLLHRARSPALPRCLGISLRDPRPAFAPLPLIPLEEGDGDPLILVEYLPGQSLEEYPREDLDPGKLGAWFDQVLDGLAWLIQAGGRPFAHLDLSPDNILIGPDDRAALIDFSSSLLTDKIQNLPPGSLRGKRAYAAPEVFLGQVGPLADLYSLAMSLLSVLAGRPAASLDSSKQKKLLKKLDPALARRVRAAMSEDPLDRLEAVEGTRYGELLSLTRKRPAKPAEICSYSLADCPFLDLARNFRKGKEESRESVGGASMLQ